MFTAENGVNARSVLDREQKESIEVTVCNSGSNIPPEQTDKIFCKFYQGDKSHSAEGNGITAFTVALSRKHS